MKICRLKLKNLNSFRNPVDIDFENPPLDHASLVAITGPTGAGKTTLLDAICVALYGKTPRLTGTGSQNPNHLISHGEKEGFAEVQFIANGTRYLATWSIRQNGAPKVQLFYADDGKLISDKLSTRGKSLGSSQNTVSEEVESILGLDFDAFRRSVMLAQGEFAAFLKASNEERRTILEATAGVSIYDVLKQALNDKVSEVETANAEVFDKLNRIPEASREQLADAETELDRLQTEADALAAGSQQIQEQKDRETKRAEDFEKLQSAEQRQKELSEQQIEIDTLVSERALAEKAQRLLPEKQAYDNAKSELEKAATALSSAEMEKTEAEKQIETDQIDFDAKEAVYQSASAERDWKVEAYTTAKSNVQRAAEQFAEAKKRDPDLAELDKQIDALESELTDKQTEQTRLQKWIDEAQTFLDVNHLPANSPQRLNDATGLLAEMTAYQKQLETASASRTRTKKKMSSLNQEIKKLSNTHAGLLSEKTEAAATLENVTAELNELIATGTREEWAARTQHAAKAQPIAQKYETIQDNLADDQNRLNDLNDTAATLNTELQQVKTDLARQTDLCQQAAKAVQRCEAERDSAKWVNPINQLRQRLQPGEPCAVCGATDHPCADVVEDENEDLLQDAEIALEKARTQETDAQAQMQSVKTKQTQTKQNKQNTTEQIEDCNAEIQTLQKDAAELLAEWQTIYSDIEVSSAWASERFTEANDAVTAIGDAEKVHTQASHADQTLSQQLENSKNNIANEKRSLHETEEQLQEVNNNIEDLEADITSIETRFWELLPDAFHGITPKAAVNQFENKIDEVETRKDERDTAKTQLQVLNTNIEADRGKFEDLEDRKKKVGTEIAEYRHDGEEILDAVRKKTDGLETENEIDTAIDTLETALQAKEDKRDEADERLQKSRELLTQKRTAHEIGEKQKKQSSEKFDNACQVYTHKLTDAGFDSPETHDNAFQDETQLQAITDQIDAHETETQQLALEVTKLKTRFKETPYDSEALERIEHQLEEIETLLQEALQTVGAQQQKIKDIKDALEKREALRDELGAAQQELERWQRLQGAIPANTLRDFALEIMFKQMGSLANEQLKYLTSERYQLKVEGIGDLSVVDRWNANEERPVETLSGGESFLTSLALALALSELSRGRAQLNSLFLDEGFGTLDAETLDIAIGALEGLRMQGRNIFLISHIRELTRRLPVKINVRKRGDDSSYGSSIDIQG